MRSFCREAQRRILSTGRGKEEIFGNFLDTRKNWEYTQSKGKAGYLPFDF